MELIGMPAKPTPGVVVRVNSRGQKSYRARVWDNQAGKAITKTFPTQAAAKSWRSAMQTKLRSGEVGAVDHVTLDQLAADWLDRARCGAVLTKGGGTYKPSTLRSYSDSLRLYVLPALGHLRITEIRVTTVQAWADQQAAAGQSRSTIRNSLAPLKILYGDAIRRGLAFQSPVDNLMVAGKQPVERDRIAAAPEVIDLLGAVPVQDRPLWATAFYAGLRCGELMALRWEDVDLLGRRITVARSYDRVARVFGPPKSRSGARSLPFPDLLLPYLTGLDRTEGLVFGSDGSTPFGYTGVRKRALKAWAASGAEPITLHECRHTYASLMLAAGVDMTKVSKWMGHSSITITVDRYGHLVPGSDATDMARFEDYLAR